MHWSRYIMAYQTEGVIAVSKTKPMTFTEFKEKFNDEDACRAYLFRRRWPSGFVCPKCRNDGYYYIKSRDLYQCKSCRHQASVTAGTAMHGTHIGLNKWLQAVYIVQKERLGYAPITLKRRLGISYKTAWRMHTRIRAATNKWISIIEQVHIVLRLLRSARRVVWKRLNYVPHMLEDLFPYLLSPPIDQAIIPRKSRYFSCRIESTSPSTLTNVKLSSSVPWYNRHCTYYTVLSSWLPAIFENRKTPDVTAKSFL